MKYRTKGRLRSGVVKGDKREKRLKSIVHKQTNLLNREPKVPTIIMTNHNLTSDIKAVMNNYSFIYKMIGLSRVEWLSSKFCSTTFNLRV